MVPPSRREFTTMSGVFSVCVKGRESCSCTASGGISTHDTLLPGRALCQPSCRGNLASQITHTCTNTKQSIYTLHHNEQVNSNFTYVYMCMCACQGFIWAKIWDLGRGGGGGGNRGGRAGVIIVKQELCWPLCS